MENEKMKRIFGDTGNRKIREGIKLHIIEVHKLSFR